MSLDLSPQSLRALLAVIETGSFTAAAERLGFTQSALSKQMSAAEIDAGLPLFRRVPRGVEPTAAALRLATRATAILDQLDAAERELIDLATPTTGRVSLGAFPTAAMHLVPLAIARLRVRHPSVSVDFSESPTPVQLRRLRAGRLDLALVATGEGLPDYDLTGIETELLPSGPLLVAVSARHRLAHASPVDVDDLVAEDWIVGRGARNAPQFGAWPTLGEPRVVAALADWSTRLGFVAAGLGITVVPALVGGVLPEGVVAVEVDDQLWTGRSMSLARVGPLDGPAEAVRSALVASARTVSERRSGRSS